MELLDLVRCLGVLLLSTQVQALQEPHSVFNFHSWSLQGAKQKERVAEEPRVSQSHDPWPWEASSDEEIQVQDPSSRRSSNVVGLPKRDAKVEYLRSGHQKRSITDRLRTINQSDPVSALFEAMENTQKLGSKCPSSGFQKLEDVVKFTVTHKPFIDLTLSALKTANMLNILFGSGNFSAALYNDAFFYAQVRSSLETDPEGLLHGSAIAFEAGQYRNGDRFCAYFYKDKQGKLHSVKQSRDDYAAEGTPGYEWFRDQRKQNYNDLLGDKRCPPRDPKSPNESVVVTSGGQGLWSGPYYKCKNDKAWIHTYSVPFFGCTESESRPTWQFKGVVKFDFNMAKWNVNQCPQEDAKPDDIFAGSHKCRPSTSCQFVANHGFRRGSYRCQCDPNFYWHPESNQANTPYFNGSTLEQTYIDKLLNTSTMYDSSYQCYHCAPGCANCTSPLPCYVERIEMLRGIIVGLTCLCLLVGLVLILIIIRLRRTKVMKASQWALLELIVLGAILLYSTIVVQYFEASNLTCVMLPWFREVGFAIVYGSLILKIYRVLAEFQSRKAHRVMVRDADMLKYLFVIVFIVVVYMAAWTAVTVDHLSEGNSMVDEGVVDDRLKYTICKARNWDFIIEIGEFLFLCFGIYLCYCIRAAPSDYMETRYISLAIFFETILSLLLHIVRRFLWLHLHPDYIYLMYFIRCQLTVTGTLFLVLGPKVWYAHRPPESDCYRNRAYSTSDAHDNPESMKLHVNVAANGDVDLGELNLADMDPEVIKEEFKRLYSELQICKTRTMRKDNPHISKRRGGRKQTHRRFSLQAFHHKHRHHHNSDDHDHEMSKTPEESTNSAEGIAISMAEESSIGEVRTPTVTFKPGHKSMC